MLNEFIRRKIANANANLHIKQHKQQNKQVKYYNNQRFNSP